MTVLSPPALKPFRTSTSSLELTGTGRWHRSRVPKVLTELSRCIRGDEHSRPYPWVLRRFRCIARVPYIMFDAKYRSATFRRVKPKDSGLQAVCTKSAPNVCKRQSEGAWCMHCRARMMVCDLTESTPITYEHKRMPAVIRSLARGLLSVHLIIGVRSTSPWSAVVHTYRVCAMRDSSRSWLVPTALMCSRERTITSTHRTDCHAGNRARPAV